MYKDRKSIYQELARVEVNDLRDKISSYIRDESLEDKIMFEIGSLTTRLIHKFLDAQNIIKSDFYDQESLYQYLELYKKVPYYGSTTKLNQICKMSLHNGEIKLQAFDYYGRDAITSTLNVPFTIENTIITIK